MHHLVPDIVTLEISEWSKLLRSLTYFQSDDIRTRRCIYTIKSSWLWAQ